MTGYLSPELRLLLLLLRGDGETDVPAVQRCGGLPDEVDEDRLVKLIERHRVTPAIAGRVDDSPVALTSATHGRLQYANRLNAVLAMDSLLVLRELLEALAAHGIEPVVLKGIPLALRTTGSIAGRQVGDIDLLIAPEDVDQALRVLWAAGFTDLTPGLPTTNPRAIAYRELTNERSLVNQERRIAVDLHWRLFPVDGLLPTRVACEGADTVSISGHPVRVLSPEVELLFLALHAAKHRWDRLQWLLDIPALVRTHQPDPIAVRQVAARAGSRAVQRSLSEAAALSAHLLGSDALSAFAAARTSRLDPLRWVPRLDSTASDGSGIVGLRGLRYRLLFGKGITYRLRVLEQTMTPPHVRLGFADRRLGVLRAGQRALRMLVGMGVRVTQERRRGARDLS